MKRILVILFLIMSSGASAQWGPQPVELRDTSVAGFVGMASAGPVDSLVHCASYADFTNVFGSSTAGLANPHLAPSVAGYFANGGASCWVVRVAADDDATVIGDPTGPDYGTGLQKLRRYDISIVAAPGFASPAVQAAMIALCRGEGDRIAILDPADPSDLAAVQAQRTTLGTDEGYAALYFPWIEASPTGTTLLLPPSGFVAGWYSATEPFRSPVGVIATATGVAYDVSAAEQEILNPQGINAIRNLSGIRIWGARTLATDPEFVYVATRRAFDCLHESIYWGTRWAVFEPYDPYTLCLEMKARVEDFMLERYFEGWFAGTTPEDCFFVQCGLGTSMTQADVDAGRLKVLYGFAPLRPAEFLIAEVTHLHVDMADVPGGAAAGITLHPATPNPFNPMTTIRFELDAYTVVSLEIFDVAGRRVRTLVSAAGLEAGHHGYRWDGRDDRGRAAPSVVYLVALRSGDEIRTRRILLAR